MEYSRFKELWKALVTNRAPATGSAAPKPCMENGVSPDTIQALVAVAKGDHSHFDGIQLKLAKHDAG